MTAIETTEKPVKTDSLARHRWMEDAKTFCAKRLKASEYTVPEQTRITIGFPSTGGRGARIGECWDPVACTDGHVEIFVSPKLADSVDIVGVLLHELVHAAVGVEAKHGPVFKAAATAVGLEGKMRSTTVGDALRADVDAWVAKRGPYPAGSLSLESRKKQTTRLLKAECETCGYTVRVTKKWVDEVGPPHCPDHGAMTVEGSSEFDPTEEGPSEDEPDDLSDILDEPADLDERQERTMDTEPEPQEGTVSHLDLGYKVVQELPDEGERSECYEPSARAKAEAKARQWSKTGNKLAACYSIRDGVSVGHKTFTGGLAPAVSGEYPLSEA